MRRRRRGDAPTSSIDEFGRRVGGWSFASGCVPCLSGVLAPHLVARPDGRIGLVSRLRNGVAVADLDDANPAHG